MTLICRRRRQGMAYFWSADYLPYLLPQNLINRLHEIQVDPWYQVQPIETMTKTNGLDGSTIKTVPSQGGRRVGRKAARKLFLEGIDVQVAQSFPFSFARAQTAIDVETVRPEAPRCGVSLRLHRATDLRER